MGVVVALEAEEALRIDGVGLSVVIFRSVLNLHLLLLKAILLVLFLFYFKLVLIDLSFHLSALLVRGSTNRTVVFVHVLQIDRSTDTFVVLSHLLEFLRSHWHNCSSCSSVAFVKLNVQVSIWILVAVEEVSDVLIPHSCLVVVVVTDRGGIINALLFILEIDVLSSNGAVEVLVTVLAIVL